MRGRGRRLLVLSCRFPLSLGFQACVKFQLPYFIWFWGSSLDPWDLSGSARKDCGSYYFCFKYCTTVITTSSINSPIMSSQLYMSCHNFSGSLGELSKKRKREEMLAFPVLSQEEIWEAFQQHMAQHCWGLLFFILHLISDGSSLLISRGLICGSFILALAFLLGSAQESI